MAAVDLCSEGTPGYTPSPRSCGPPVYLIEQITVSDAVAFGKEFGPLAQAANKEAAVRSLAAGGQITAIDGEAPKSRVVVQVWESIEKIQAFRHRAVE